MKGEVRLSEAYITDEGPWARSHEYARTPRPRDFSEDSDRRRDGDGVSSDLGARFHHLACAAQHQPYMLRSALASATVEVPGRAELERAIERALSVVDVVEEGPGGLEVEFVKAGRKQVRNVELLEDVED